MGEQEGNVPHEQTEEVLNISCVAVPLPVPPWAGWDLLVASGVLSLDERLTAASFLPSCVGTEFSHQHPQPGGIQTATRRPLPRSSHAGESENPASPAGKGQTQSKPGAFT